MRLVYIAGRFRGANSWEVQQHVFEAEAAALRVADLGGMPVVPHSLGQHMLGTVTEEFWQAGTLLLLSRCDGILLLPNWIHSEGARAESDYAERHGIVRWGLGALNRGDFFQWLNRPLERGQALRPPPK